MRCLSAHHSLSFQSTTRLKVDRSHHEKSITIVGLTKLVPSSETMPSFLTLPREIRFMVYSYLLEERSLWLRGLNPPASLESPEYTRAIPSVQKQILHVCRSLREEASIFFYSNIRLRLDTLSFGPKFTTMTDSSVMNSLRDAIDPLRMAVRGWENGVSEVITKVGLISICRGLWQHWMERFGLLEMGSHRILLSQAYY